MTTHGDALALARQNSDDRTRDSSSSSATQLSTMRPSADPLNREYSKCSLTIFGPNNQAVVNRTPATAQDDGGDHRQANRDLTQRENRGDSRDP
jgi:hypothetical protein